MIDLAGVDTQRPAALERIALVLADWQHTQTRQADAEARMTGMLDAMSLTALVTSIPGEQHGQQGRRRRYPQAISGTDLHAPTHPDTHECTAETIQSAGFDGPVIDSSRGVALGAATTWTGTTCGSSVR